MDWIKQGIDAWRKMASELDAVTDSADSIYDDLWDEILKVVEAASREGIALVTNGQPQKRAVIMESGSGRFGPPVKQDRRLSIDLAKDKRSIIAVSDEDNILLKIEVCPDGVVCLKYRSNRITSRDAAKEIMEGFLFRGSSPFSSRDSGDRGA